MEHNEKHGITPRSVVRAVQESLQGTAAPSGSSVVSSVVAETGGDFDITEVIREMEGEMQEASAGLEFEKAALLRDQIAELKSQLEGKGAGPGGRAKTRR